MSNGRPLIVITNPALVTFRVPEAERWEPIPLTAAERPLGIKVYKAEPGNGTPAALVAAFSDVHAVYFEEDVALAEVRFEGEEPAS